MNEKNEERHTQAAYEHARAEKIRRLEEENRILTKSLETTEKHMVTLWEEIEKLKDVIAKLAEEL